MGDRHGDRSHFSRKETVDNGTGTRIHDRAFTSYRIVQYLFPGAHGIINRVIVERTETPAYIQRGAALTGYSQALSSRESRITRQLVMNSAPSSAAKCIRPFVELILRSCHAQTEHVATSGVGFQRTRIQSVEILEDSVGSTKMVCWRRSEWLFYVQSDELERRIVFSRIECSDWELRH
jgi:hypothetical protein